MHNGSDMQESPRTPQYVFEVNLFTICRETSVRLDTLLERAREAKDLHAAKEFVSYLQWSGILKLLEYHSQPEPLKIDGSHIRWKAEQLLSVVHQQLKQKQVVVSLELSQLESVNHKLDLIAGRLACLTPTTSEGVETAKEDSLTIVNERVA